MKDTTTETLTLDDRRKLCGKWWHETGTRVDVGGVKLPYASVMLNDMGGIGWYDDGEYAWSTLARMVANGTLTR